jgi:HSP20 family protein
MTRANGFPWQDDWQWAADRFWNTFEQSRGAARPFPAFNVRDEGERLTLEAEVPGVRREDLEIEALPEQLTVRGRRRPLDEPEAVYHRQERGVGEFVRTLQLPVDVDAERVEATLADGVLTLHMPKSERSRPRRIDLRTE